MATKGKIITAIEKLRPTGSSICSRRWTERLGWIMLFWIFPTRSPIKRIDRGSLVSCSFATIAFMHTPGIQYRAGWESYQCLPMEVIVVKSARMAGDGKSVLWFWPRGTSPTALACKSLVEQGKHLGHVELDVLEIEVFLVVLLHFEQIVELQVEL